MSTQTGKGTAVITLPSDTELRIVREFNAPPHLVYRAWTEPDLVRRWWAADHGAMTAADIDLRVGGAWRWAMMTNEGFEVAFHGEYKELVPDERIVMTEVYEAVEGEGTLNELTFTEKDGRTTLDILVKHADKAGRDAQIASGMESGVQTGFDLLEEMAVQMKG